MASEDPPSGGREEAPSRLIRVRVSFDYRHLYRARLEPEVIWQLAKRGIMVVIEEEQ